jgi:oligosaccharyltransferase complex subunit gamma
MRLTWILSSLLLPLVAFAAKKPAADPFTETYSKALPAWLDDYSYQKLTTVPRDYAIAVLLTALEPRFGCAACRDFQVEWDILAKSWQKGDKAGESRMLFGTLDFADGKGTFQAVCLPCEPLKDYDY